MYSIKVDFQTIPFDKVFTTVTTLVRSQILMNDFIMSSQISLYTCRIGALVTLEQFQFQMNKICVPL